MSQTVNGFTVIATKQASGTVQLIFQSAVGGIIYSAVIPSADFTNINTNVNGGSTGATRTFTYVQDANKSDYPTGHGHGEGN